MSILLIIIGISVLILIHEAGHFLVAKKLGLLVEEFGFGFPPRLWSKKIGETTYSLNLLPFGGFVKIHGEQQADQADIPERAFFTQKAWKRSLIIVAGVFMNFILGWLLMSLIFFVGVPKTVLLSQVAAGSPADLAGLKAGDRVANFEKSQDFIDFVNKNRGQKISLTVQRGSESLNIALTPRLIVPEGEGPLGVALVEAGVDKRSFFASLYEGLKNSLLLMWGILLGLFNLIASLVTQGQVLAGFVGPVGIFGVANQAGELGMIYLVQLLALISLNLTILNVLPFPALDGGRLFFILLEKIKGSPLSPSFERSANAAGFVFLLFVMIAITVRDIIALL